MRREITVDNRIALVDILSNESIMSNTKEWYGTGRIGEKFAIIPQEYNTEVGTIIVIRSSSDGTFDFIGSGPLLWNGMRIRKIDKRTGES